jgi:hypothetical protein
MKKTVHETLIMGLIFITDHLALACECDLWGSHFTSIASSFEMRGKTKIPCTRVSVYARPSKISHTGGKCGTCCGYTFSKPAEEAITGPTWCIATVIGKNTHCIERTQKEKKRQAKSNDMEMFQQNHLVFGNFLYFVSGKNQKSIHKSIGKYWWN